MPIASKSANKYVRADYKGAKWQKTKPHTYVMIVGRLLIVGKDSVQNVKPGTPLRKYDLVLKLARMNALMVIRTNVQATIQPLCDIDLADLPRFTSGFNELDRVLGGVIVPGSATLIGGTPGAGKSTLLLQLMCYLSQKMKA